MGEKRRNQSFILHGGILAIAGIIVRVIGMLYRIPMVNIIGEEGTGIYSMAFNVYNIILILSSYGMPMAVSKLISGRISVKNYKNAYRVFTASLTVSIVMGGFFSILLYWGSDLLEKYVYSGYSGIAIPLKVLAPTIFIVAVLGVFRGFCQGQNTMIPTAISQLLEQIVNAVTSIVACYYLVRIYKDSSNVAGYGAAGGTLGTTLGALTALIFIVFVYIIYRPVFQTKIRNDNSKTAESYWNIYKTIGITLIPIMLGQTFYQISSMLDDIIYGKYMAAQGIQNAVNSSNIGIYNSCYMLLIGLPMGIASAMSASMLPSIVASKAQKKFSEINIKIRKTIKINMIVAIPSFIGLAVLGKPIVQLLFPSYNSNTGAAMLQLGAVAVIFYTISTVSGSALQGIDKMNLPVKHSCISLVVHIVLIILLLKYTDLGIYALVIGNATFPILVMILNLISLHSYTKYRQEIKDTFLIPFICAIFMGIVSGIMYKIVFILTNSNFISLFIALIIAGISYFGLILLLKKKKMY